MSLSVDAARADTPGVEHVVHLNNAGSALPPRVVTDTVVGHIRREAEIGGYEAAEEAAGRIEAVYASLAALIGATPREIAVVENATRAWDMAVYGYSFRPGDRVLTGRSEYSSNAIALLQLQRRIGIELVVIDDDEHGQISLDRLDAELEKGAAMVALTHVPTNGGLVNPAAAVGELCRGRDVCFVLDACQSVGQMPIDVGAIGCDVLSSTGRKFLRGPRGTGFLYVRDEWIGRIEPPLLDLHAAAWPAEDRYEIRDDARRFENWECAYAGKLGLGAAVDYALVVGVEEIWARVEPLAERLRDELRTVPGARVLDKGEHRCAIVTFTIADRDAHDIQRTLRERGINTSVTTAEFARYDFPRRGIDAAVRASVHYYNVDDDLDRLVSALRDSPA